MTKMFRNEYEITSPFVASLSNQKQPFCRLSANGWGGQFGKLFRTRSLDKQYSFWRASFSLKQPSRLRVRHTNSIRCSWGRREKCLSRAPLASSGATILARLGPRRKYLEVFWTYIDEAKTYFFLERRMHTAPRIWGEPGYKCPVTDPFPLRTNKAAFMPVPAKTKIEWKSAKMAA